MCDEKSTSPSKPSPSAQTGPGREGMWPIWQISPKYKCPVIGTCLNSEEHKKLVKKVGFKPNQKKPYDLHKLIMNQLEDENPLSRKVENYLRSKYRELLIQMAGWSADRVKQAWRKAFDSGSFDGMFYVIAVNQTMPDELKDDVFGDVHMMSHHFMEKAHKSASKICQMQNSLAEKDNQVSHLKNQIRQLRKEILVFKQSGVACRNTDSGGRQESEKETAMPAIVSENKRLKLQIERLENDKTELGARLNKAENANQRLEKSLMENEALNRHLKGDIEDLISHFSLLGDYNQTSVDPTETKVDLFSKRILIVGGMTKIKHLYQHLVEKNGGQFEYHDGYMRNGSKGLDNQVRRSDIILCPVNCNSHNACTKVKKLCNKHRKPLKILANASISSISSALFHDQVEINQPAGSTPAGRSQMTPGIQ